MSRPPAKYCPRYLAALEEIRVELKTRNYEHVAKELQLMGIDTSRGHISRIARGKVKRPLMPMFGSLYVCLFAVNSGVSDRVIK
jgi:hypothetical protein